MNQKQELHLSKLRFRASNLLDIKYRKGAAHHGGELENFSPNELIDAAIDEAIDQVVYLLTLKDKINE